MGCRLSIFIRAWIDLDGADFLDIFRRDLSLGQGSTFKVWGCKYFTEMSSGSEEGSYTRTIDVGGLGSKVLFGG